MSTTLTYGRKVPDLGDRGAPLFSDLEQNIILDDGHTHDGINSPLLTAQAFVGIPQTILSANWVTYGGPVGHYRQTVTVLPGFLFDTTKIAFRTTAGAYIYPTVERVTGTTYNVYSTNNAIDFVAVYGG
jgi:hypothetical protein